MSDDKDRQRRTSSGISLDPLYRPSSVSAEAAYGDTIAAAQSNAYRATEKITWPDVHYRKDIGYRAVNR